ncbi:MAG: hypothetical protein VX733_11295 [Candidatus Latescibacterota bacterium]|nr:hypothetical protein [Candidatus Latescibacterota bacterium]
MRDQDSVEYVVGEGRLLCLGDTGHRGRACHGGEQCSANCDVPIPGSG